MTLSQKCVLAQEFDLLHQTVSHHEGVGSGDETKRLLLLAPKRLSGHSPTHSLGVQSLSNTNTVALLYTFQPLHLHTHKISTVRPQLFVVLNKGEVR